MPQFAETAAEAVADVTDGATVLMGGFGNAGQPMELIDALLDSGANDLTVVNNNAGQGDAGLALLIKERRVKKIICSFPRQSDSWHFDAAFRAGEVELELVPQGNLAERLRAAGAGIGAFFTPTGYGTELAAGKETRKSADATTYLSIPLAATSRSSRRCTQTGQGTWRIARLPETSARDGRSCNPHGSPGGAVAAYRVSGPRSDRDPGAVCGHRNCDRDSNPERSRVRTASCGEAPLTRRRSQSMSLKVRPTAARLSRQELAQAVARDIASGSYANLGIGQPTMVADYLTPEQNVTLHTENGMLGMGPKAAAEQVDADLINAGKVPVTELPGASYFHHADSFAMMRGGHLDVCVLGAFQVSVTGT